MSIFSKRRRRDQVRQERPPAEGAAASGSDTWVLGQGEAGPTPVHHGGAGPVRSAPNGPEVPWPPGEQGAEQGPPTEEGTATDQDGGGSEGERSPEEEAPDPAAAAVSPEPAPEPADVSEPEPTEAVDVATQTAATGNGEVAGEPPSAGIVDPDLVRIRTLVAAVREAREAPAERRLAVLGDLEGVDDPDAHEVILAALTHDLSEGVRSRAVRLLESAPPEVRAEGLRIAATDPQAGVRTAAIERLVREGDDEVAPIVLRLLDDPDDTAAQVAGEVLVRRIGSDPATIWAALKRASGSRRERLKVVLAGERPEELERLRAHHAGSTDPDDRALAAELLPARDERSAADTGLRLLRDPSGQVRTAAARSLARVRTDEVTAALREALADPSPAVRLEAVRALLGRDDAPSIDGLLERLGDPDARIRAAVIEGLERRASRGLAHRAITALEDVRLRAGATELLVSMDRFAEPLLLEVLPDRGGDVRIALGAVLEQVVGTDELGRRLTSVDRQVRESTVEALSSIGTPAAVGHLLRSLDDPDEEIRLRAVRRLATTDDPRAIAALRSTAERDPVRQIAEAAREGLAAHDVVIDRD